MLITTDLAHASKKKKSGEKKEMLSYSFEEDGRIRVKINSSSLDIIQTCARKTYYSLVKGLRSPNESNATLFGTAIHAALETYYLGNIKDRRFSDGCRKNFELLAYGGTCDDHNDCLLCNSVRSFVDAAQPLNVLDEYAARSIPAGVWTLEHYFDNYLLDPFSVVLDDEGKPMVEKMFTIPLIDDEEMIVEIFGTIDVILKNENSGQILVCDHKTTSVLGNDFFNRLKPNHQYTTYIIGAQRALGLETETFLVNGVQVKGKPKTKRGGPPNLVRQTTNRNKQDVEEFKMVMRNSVRILKSNLERDEWPYGPVNACAMYGGCQYLDICSVPEVVRENIIKARFE